MRPHASPFVVRLAEIPEEGLDKDIDLGAAFAEQALAGTEAHPGKSAPRARLTLHRTGREVLARGRIAGDIEAVCSRCAGKAAVAVDEPFDALFVPRASAAARGGDEAPEPDQPDVVPYDAEEIDLAETLREELLLALPIAPLCADGCRGLCPRCGADLNQGPCDCREEAVDDRWAALRNLKV